MPFFITREIGIDAGHRVKNHGSKCRNLHGHRYTIEATLEAPALIGAGPSEGMIMDFGFLKEIMMEEIDTPCDHGLILWIRDHELLTAMLPKDWVAPMETIERGIELNGYWEGVGLFGKLYVIPAVPTAENLAKHWFFRLSQKVLTRAGNQASLLKIRVYETPNCWADYGP